eukprot:1936296-Amphidinium_carterae.1
MSIRPMRLSGAEVRDAGGWDVEMIESSAVALRECHNWAISLVHKPRYFACFGLKYFGGDGIVKTVRVRACPWHPNRKCARQSLAREVSAFGCIT